MLRIKLGHLDKEINARQVVAKSYLQGINNPLVELPSVEDVNAHVWHLFVIKTKHREQLVKYLADNGVQTLVHYPIPPHQQGAYQEWHGSSFPISENIHEQVISLPISSVINSNELNSVIKLLNSYK